MENKKNIEKFEKLLNGVKRDGIPRLIEFIRKSDFYTAPASTRYHNSFEGGLLEHSLNVYDCLEKKHKDSFWKEAMGDLEEESIIIIALLHDLCKTYFYTTELKNRKTYEPEKVAAAQKWQVKHDDNGDFIWETVPSYTVEDKVPYGHGEKSAMMVEEYIKLKPAERYAIRWHMGFTEPKESYNTLSAALAKYPIILAVHEADLEATYLLEK